MPGGGGSGTDEKPKTKKQIDEESIDKIQDPFEKALAIIEYIEKYGGKDGTELGKILRELLNTKYETTGELYDVFKAIDKIYLAQRGKEIMEIFSVDNVSIILALGLSPNLSTNARNKVFRLVSRIGPYQTIGNLINTHAWYANGMRVIFKGFTDHATIAYGMSKGLSASFISNMIRFGTTRVVNHARWGAQLFVEYGGKAIVVDISGGRNHGKIITYLLKP